MNIYDKITNCEKITCFIEGDNINCVTLYYKKKMSKIQFYDATISFIDNCAKSFLLKEVTICGYKTENSKVLKTLFSGSYIELQKLFREVI